MPRRSISQAELRAFRRAFERASREKDRDALDRMLHDEFTLVDPDGLVVDKEGLIKAIVDPKSTFMRQFRRSERRSSLAVRGNTARDTADVQLSGTLADAGDITGEYVNTATFIRTNPSKTGVWQMLGNSLTKKAT